MLNGLNKHFKQQSALFKGLAVSLCLSVCVSLSPCVSCCLSLFGTILRNILVTSDWTENEKYLETKTIFLL